MRVLFDTVLVDTRLRIAAIGDTPIRLTWQQHEALRVFVEANGEPVTRATLSQRVLRRELYNVEDRSVDQFITLLRRKLPARADGAPLIQSVPGIGFWMPPGVPV